MVGIPYYSQTEVGTEAIIALIAMGIQREFSMLGLCLGPRSIGLGALDKARTRKVMCFRKKRTPDY